MMELLLSYGAPVNQCTDASFGGLAPLHVAARYDQVQAGRALVLAGADPNVRAAGNQATPLHQCAQFGSSSFASWLLSIPGVEGAAVDASGFSAHYYAKKAGFVTLARLLPAVKYDLWKQMESEPHYAANIGAVKTTIEKKEALAAKKAEALEKKKKKKLW
jgi:ankyrin repeat protein